MAETSGGVIAAFLIIFVLSRITLWLFQSLGEGLMRVLSGHLAALATACVVDSFVIARGGLPSLPSTVGTYLLPTAVWGAFDLVRYWRSSARA